MAPHQLNGRGRGPTQRKLRTTQDTHTTKGSPQGEEGTGDRAGVRVNLGVSDLDGELLWLGDAEDLLAHPGNRRVEHLRRPELQAEHNASPTGLVAQVGSVDCARAGQGLADQRQDQSLPRLLPVVSFLGSCGVEKPRA